MMELKDKLDLLWKYLLLIVVFWGFYLHHHGVHSDRNHYPDIEQAGRTVEVEMEIINGDTNLTMTINGKKIDDGDYKELEKELVEIKAGYKNAIKKKIITE